MEMGPYTVDRDSPLYPAPPPLPAPPCRGSAQPKSQTQLSSQPCGLQRIGKTTIVATMDNRLACYTGKVGGVEGGGWGSGSGRGGNR